MQVFYDELKIGKVIPIHTKGKKDVLSNYKPVTLVPTLSKDFERLIATQIIKSLDSNNFLSKCQFGFINIALCKMQLWIVSIMSYRERK